MTETVVVTGGSGRVGRGVLAYLNEEGYRTANLSRGKRDEKHSDVYLRTDLVDAGEVYSSLAKSDADAVVHLGMIRRRAKRRAIGRTRATSCPAISF